MSKQQYIVETIFRAVDKMSGAVRAVNSVLGKHTRAVKAAVSAVRKWSFASAKALNSAGQWASLRITAPLLLVGGAALKASGDLEQMGIAFQTMLRDADRGNKVLDELIQFANVTPFQTEEVVRAGKVMLAMGVSAEDLGARLKMMGDIAAGTGQPLVELASIFGKTRAKGMMMTEELYQFAERGLPIIEILQKRLGLSGEELLEAASKRQITFDLALRALKSMTGEGGQFKKMMEKLSHSLLGKWSTFTSKVWLTSGAIGDVLDKMFGIRDLLDQASAFADRIGPMLKNWVSENPQLAKMAAYLTAIITLSAPLLFFFAALAWAVGALLTPIGAVAAGLLLLGAAVGAMVYYWDDFREMYPGIADAFQFIGNGIMFFVDAVDFAIRGLAPFMSELLKLVDVLLSIPLNPFQGIKDLWNLLGRWGNNILQYGDGMSLVLQQGAADARARTGLGAGAGGYGDIGLSLPAPAAAANGKVDVNIRLLGDDAARARVSAEARGEGVEPNIYTEGAAG